MDEVAFERMQAFDIWPFPVVEDSTPVDQDVTLVFYGLVCFHSMNLDFPDSLFLVPDRLSDAMTQLYVLVKLILVRNTLEVLENLVPWRITGHVSNDLAQEITARLVLLVSPLRVRFPGKLIIVGWNVASAPRIPRWISVSSQPILNPSLWFFRFSPVLKPGSSNISILFVDGELVVLHVQFHVASYVQPTCTRSHNYYAYWSGVTQWLFGDLIHHSVLFSLEFSDVVAQWTA